MLVVSARAPMLFAVAGLIIGLASIDAFGQSETLFSRNRYPTEQRKNCISFIEKTWPSDPCDVTYGNLWAGGELDWFNKSGAMGNRSVIKDLGPYKWSDKFSVPVVAALPMLKPGEVRAVTVSTSGGNVVIGGPIPKGANGAAANGTGGQNAKGSVAGARSDSIPQPVELGEPSKIAPVRPKLGGKQRIDPMFTKAVAGHMYVIHVVDDNHDFYALFRVDELVRGDLCVVSWKLIDPPSEAVK